LRQAAGQEARPDRALGFVDVEVCAIGATWSGLKPVVRKPTR
jgi:hypothetical protein